MKKIITAFVLAAVCVGGMAAQDVIFRTQKDSIKAKIVTVSDEEITPDQATQLPQSEKMSTWGKLTNFFRKK